MLIKMLGDISGLRNGTEWPKRGGLVELPDDEAEALCANGMAELYDGDADDEDTPPVETAAAPKGKTETR